MENKIFTIILSNYNQEKYVFEALDSILNQTYENIQLIISDDASSFFEKEKIEDYIKSKRKNIDYIFIINKKNIGTVKTFNKCFKKATGNFVTIIAADDKYFDKDVIKRYAEFFLKNENAKMVTSITHLYDNNFQLFFRDFPSTENKSFFELSSKGQNKELFFGPVFAPGATAYRMSLIKELGYYDERYTLVEDWSFFLRTTRLNIKTYFINSPSLMHRGGGLSESSKINIKPYKLMIEDTKLIYQKEIFPFFKKLKDEEIIQIMKRFKLFILYNNIFNISIFIEYLKQGIFNKYYRKVVLKNKKESILSLILSSLILCVIMDIIYKMIIVVISILLYKFILIIIKAIQFYIKKIVNNSKEFI